MGPLAIMTALTVASATSSTYASWKKSKADRQSALNRQAIIEAEKNEIIKRSAYNQMLLRRKLTSDRETFLGNLSQNAFVGYGHRLSMAEGIEDAVTKAKEEADYMAASRAMEAEAMGSQAAAINRLTPITALSGGLSTANSLFLIYGAASSKGAPSSKDAPSSKKDV